MPDQEIIEDGDDLQQQGQKQHHESSDKTAVGTTSSDSEKFAVSS